MAQNTKETTRSKRRTQVKELPKTGKQLSKEEQKKIKGGLGAGPGASVDLYATKPKP